MDPAISVEARMHLSSCEFNLSLPEVRRRWEGPNFKLAHRQCCRFTISARMARQPVARTK